MITATPATSTTDVATDDEAVEALRELAAYVDRRSVAFCSSSVWLRAAATHLGARPVVVTVRRGDAPVALAALGVRTRHGVTQVQLLGGELNDYGQLFHDDQEAATGLADALVSWLAGHRRWSLRLGQLPPDDPALAALSARVAGAAVEAGAPMPRITGIGTDYRISGKRRRQGTNATNRIGNDGRSWETVVVRDRASLERWLPGVIELRRRRDHAAGRRSHLDDPGTLAFYRAVVEEFVVRGRAVIHLLAVDGRVAGYALPVFDGEAHRLLDGRVGVGFERYRGGMVCDLASVSAAELAPEVRTFDWLRGRTEAKFGNDEIHRVELRATSHALVAAVEDWDAAARCRVKAVLPDAAVRRLVAR